MMDNKKIISEFNAYVDGFIEFCTSDHEVHELLNAVQKVIEEQEERIAIMSEGGWISVSKRLPKKTGFYIVSINKRVIDDHGEHLELKSTEMWFDGEQKVFTEHCVVFNPTHWMPLPEPPKGEES